MFPVEWSAEAETSYTRTLLSRKKWTIREINNFVLRTEQVLAFIKENPRIYPCSQTQGVHRALISSQTSLYYEIYKDKIVLLNFADNRQDPEKRKY